MPGEKCSRPPTMRGGAAAADDTRIVHRTPTYGSDHEVGHALMAPHCCTHAKGANNLYTTVT
jgi:hypothetical protein